MKYIYPYQNTLLEYKTNKRVGFQNNFKMRHESLGLYGNSMEAIIVGKSTIRRGVFFVYLMLVIGLNLILNSKSCFSEYGNMANPIS